MKYLSIILLLLIGLTQTAIAQNAKCSRETSFGKKKICIPKIKEYTECYSNSTVKALADATEVESNIVLGFYLNNETYAKRDSLGLISFDDYFKIYATKSIQDLKADHALLDELIKQLSGNFMSQNWDEISEEIEELDLDMEIGTPIVVDNYRLNDDSFSMIMIVKYQFEGMEPYTMAMTINGFIQNERLLWMAYYRNYENKKTIKTLKSRSDSILEQIIAASE